VREVWLICKSFLLVAFKNKTLKNLKGSDITAIICGMSSTTRSVYKNSKNKATEL